MDSQPFQGLFRWIDRHPLVLTLGVLVLQLGILAGDIFVYAGKKNLIPYPLEIALPYLFIPALRPLAKKVKPSADLSLMGGMALLLFGITTLAMAVFQVLAWRYGGNPNGAIFYIPSTVLAVVWAFRSK